MKKIFTLLAATALLVGCGDTYDSSSETESSPPLNEPAGSSVSPGTVTNENSLGTSRTATNQNQAFPNSQTP